MIPQVRPLEHDEYVTNPLLRVVAQGWLIPHSDKDTSADKKIKTTNEDDFHPDFNDRRAEIIFKDREGKKYRVSKWYLAKEW